MPPWTIAAIRRRSGLAWALVLAPWVFGATVARADFVEELRASFASKTEAIHTALWEGRWEYYFTGYAWHASWGYRPATRARLNETTWGGGFGRTMKDADGDRHSVFVLALSDSHRRMQYMASYGWQRYLSPRSETGVGWGYMAFLFAREDVAGYCPLPAVLPCASFRSRNWEVIGLFVPRVSKDIKGDVFFVFLRCAR